MKTEHQPLCAIIATLNYSVWIRLLRKQVVKVCGLLRTEKSTVFWEVSVPESLPKFLLL